MFNNRDSLLKEFNSIPYLFHYTTAETLKKIITSKAFKFSRNDRLNDKIEETRSPYVQYYVSCFSCVKEESIPLWYIYDSTAETP